MAAGATRAFPPASLDWARPARADQGEGEATHGGHSPEPSTPQAKVTVLPKMAFPQSAPLAPNVAVTVKLPVSAYISPRCQAVSARSTGLRQGSRGRGGSGFAGRASSAFRYMWEMTPLYHMAPQDRWCNKRPPQTASPPLESRSRGNSACSSLRASPSRRDLLSASCRIDENVARAAAPLGQEGVSLTDTTNRRHIICRRSCTVPS